MGRTMVQLELPLYVDLPPDNPIARIEYVVSSIKYSTDRVRKGMYAKHNELQKRCQELEERLKIIEKEICLKW